MLVNWEIDSELEKGWWRRVEEILLKSWLAASDKNAYFQEIGFNNYKTDQEIGEIITTRMLHQQKLMNLYFFLK